MHQGFISQHDSALETIRVYGILQRSHSDALNKGCHVYISCCAWRVQVVVLVWCVWAGGKRCRKRMLSQDLGFKIVLSASIMFSLRPRFGPCTLCARADICMACYEKHQRLVTQQMCVTLVSARQTFESAWTGCGVLYTYGRSIIGDSSSTATFHHRRSR